MSIRTQKYAPALLLCALSLLFCGSASFAAPKVDLFTLNETYVKMYWDESFQIHITVSPSDAEWARTEYVSSSPRVANVTQSGRVYGRDSGDTWITVRIVNYDGTSMSQRLKVRIYDSWGWGGISFGSGGGCSVAPFSSVGLLLPFVLTYRRKKRSP